MNRRLQQFLAAENISQAQFAETINVARATVSHVLAGRNNPGYDFIQSVSSHYPDLSLDWLINGTGRMYKSKNAASSVHPEPTDTSSDDLFGPLEDENDIRTATDTPNTASSTSTKDTSATTQPIENQRKISRIIVFYDDGTFLEIK